MDFESLEGTFIPNVFRDRTWAPHFIGSVDVHHILIGSSSRMPLWRGSPKLLGEREGVHCVSHVYPKLPTE